MLAAIPALTFVTAGFRPGFYRTLRRAHNTEAFSRSRIQDLWNPNARPAFLLSECKLEGGVMRNFSRGIWTWAALYVAFGLIGIFLLTGQSTIVTSSEGYGIAAIASPAPLR